MYNNPLKLRGFLRSFSFSRLKEFKSSAGFFSGSTTGLFSHPFPRSLSSTPMNCFKNPKTRSKQTMISSFFPDAVPPSLDTVSPEVSAVDGSPLDMELSHYFKPTLIGIVDANLTVILCCLPSCPVVNTAAPGSGDASSTHHSAVPKSFMTLYKGPCSFCTQE